MLVDAAQAGDQRALDTLLRRHYDRIWAVCRRLAGNDADAADATQEALITIARRLDRFDGRAAFSTWAYRVAANLCTDRLRRRKTRGAVDIDAVPEPESEVLSAVEQMTETARAEALQAALDTLPDRQRQAVVLRHLEGLSNPEIAQILDVGVEAVESLTARGKRALKAALQTRKEELGYENG